MKKRTATDLRVCREYYDTPSFDIHIPSLTRHLIIDLIDEVLSSRREISRLKRALKSK